MRPQAKECPEPLEAERGKEGAGAPPEGVWWLTLAFVIPGSRKKCETIRFCYFKLLSLLWQPHGRHLKK